MSGRGGEPVAAGDRDDDPLHVAAIARAFRVLEALSAADRPMTLTQLVRPSGLGKSAVQRITHTLGALGYLKQDAATRAWSLSSRMLAFSQAVLGQDRVREAALPHLEALARECGETVNLTRLEGVDVVYIARYPSVHAVSVDLRVGSRLPAFCTSPGRAMLARLPADESHGILARSARKAWTANTVTETAKHAANVDETRKRGYAVNDQETFAGDVSIAAAPVDAAGQVAGATDIAAPSPRWTLAELQRKLARRLVRAAGEVSKGLGVAG